MRREKNSSLTRWTNWPSDKRNERRKVELAQKEVELPAQEEALKRTKQRLESSRQGALQRTDIIMRVKRELFCDEESLVFKEAENFCRGQALQKRKQANS
jgi:uncharacterized protein HemY